MTFLGSVLYIYNLYLQSSLRIHYVCGDLLKKILLQPNLKTATSESSKFDQNIELVWCWFLSSSFDFPNTLIHFVLVFVIDRTLKHKKIVSHQNHEHNLGHKVTNFFCQELTKIQQKLFFFLVKWAEIQLKTNHDCLDYI